MVYISFIDFINGLTHTVPSVYNVSFIFSETSNVEKVEIKIQSVFTARCFLWDLLLEGKFLSI